MSEHAYLDHGRRHSPDGSDPIPGLVSGAITNDWVYASTPLGTVNSGVVTIGAFSGINYQTDSGSVFDVYTGSTHDSIQMLQVGSYLIRARATFPNGHSGLANVDAIIGGDVTTTDYFIVAGVGNHGTDSAGGEVIWEQLCVVNDLTVPAAAYIEFKQTTGLSLVGCVGYIQIFRFT